MKPTFPLATHGRFAYRAITDRPDWSWPNNARLAVYLGLNLEHFAFGEGLGAELAPGGPQPDVLNHAWRDYGNRVGAWRLIEMFDALALPCSVLLNSAMYDHAPTLVAAHRRRGDEILGHGRSNSERQSVLSETDEARLIAEATDAIVANEGKHPRGWLSPWIAESSVTPDLLAEAGYSFTLNWCADDQPIWMTCRGGRRLLAVPYPMEVNDIPSIAVRKDSAEQFAGMIVENFEEMVAQSAAQPLVMGVALHPYLVGQPYRLRALRRALAHLAEQRDRVWFTTAGAIADYAMALPDGTLA
jgi:peptidoglycan/xylan/chitin deacetylase (PgdA/CDA1 family)